MQFASISFTMTGTCIAAIGFIIRQFSLVNIILGYDPDKVVNKKGMARWVGKNLMLMGLTCALPSFIRMFIINYEGFIPLFIEAALYLSIIGFFSLRLANGYKMFEKP